VERLKVAKFGIGLEAVQGFRDAIERGLAEAFGFGQVGEVRALDPLVLWVKGFHWPELS